MLVYQRVWTVTFLHSKPRQKDDWDPQLDSGATFGWRGSASILPRSLAWIANLSCIANWKIYEHITIKNTWAILQTKWLIFHSLCLFTVG
jgi:hypothetical protein